MLRKTIVFACLMNAAFSFAQFSISGSVTDSEGLPLIGANIFLNGTGLGTTSDFDGEFRIQNIPRGTYLLKTSYLGYKPASKEVIINSDIIEDIVLELSVIFGEEIIVSSTRAGGKTPTTYSVVEKSDIQKRNFGQDLPYLLNLEPSLVTTSDAGAGVGYTGMWIRGSNIQRINVTINGIPVNDPESHGVFWVNMPDFSSSVQSAQIQRGVGTSTNGGGAFGATINLQTDKMNHESFAELNSSFGSFNTWKGNVRFGSGLIKDHWAFEGRTSIIKSDGYIDRAGSDLRSLYLQGGYFTNKTKVKGVFFTGKEKTHQAWYGVDQWTIDTYGRKFNPAGVVFGKSDNGETDWWNYDNIDLFYDNQTDNYQQDHYQLHLVHSVSPNFNFNASVHYTYGRGYYEEYYQEEALDMYPIGIQYFAPDSVLTDGDYEYFFRDSVTHSDMIVRRWLDNHFYGGTFGINYSIDKLDLIVGGAWNKYANAKHFGEIIWAQYTGETTIRDQFYNNISDKTDFTSYIKLNYELIPDLSLFVDLQYRGVNYKGQGTDKGGATISIDERYDFFNPKIGMSYDLSDIGLIYASYAIANREPIRTDFTDAPDGVKPEPERLGDLEAGIRKSTSGIYYNLNVYWMKYTNQLVLTGEINDVGSPIRENVGKSYRIGIELDAMIKVTSFLNLRANLAISENKTDYRQVVEGEILEYKNTTISFSPSVVSGGEIEVIPVKNLTMSLTGKYVGQQYLDNTENKDLSLDPYFINDFRIRYSMYPKIMEELSLSLMINNVFNTEYISNGYLWGTTPYYYPQAGINFLAGISLRF